MNKLRLFESYLENRLSLDEKLKFEKELVINKKLSAELKMYKEVNTAIIDDELNTFRQKVGDILNNHKKKANFSSLFSDKFIKYPILAFIAILISFSIWKILSLDSSDKIFSDYYEPFIPDISARSVNTGKDKIQLASLLYQEGDYKKSTDILKSFLLVEPDHQTALFYYGLNAIQESNYNLAITNLKEIERSLTTPFAIHARWYLALTLLKAKQPFEAKKYLVQLSKEGNLYTEKAKRILKKLKY